MKKKVCMYIFLSAQGQKNIIYWNANNITSNIQQTVYAQRTHTSWRRVTSFVRS